MGLLSQISLALGKLVRLWYEVTEGYVRWECRLEAEDSLPTISGRKGHLRLEKSFIPHGQLDYGLTEAV